MRSLALRSLSPWSRRSTMHVLNTTLVQDAAFVLPWSMHAGSSSPPLLRAAYCWSLCWACFLWRSLTLRRWQFSQCAARGTALCCAEQARRGCRRPKKGCLPILKRCQRVTKVRLIPQHSAVMSGLVGKACAQKQRWSGKTPLARTEDACFACNLLFHVCGLPGKMTLALRHRQLTKCLQCRRAAALNWAFVAAGCPAALGRLSQAEQI